SSPSYMLRMMVSVSRFTGLPGSSVIASCVNPTRNSVAPADQAAIAAITANAKPVRLILPSPLPPAQDRRNGHGRASPIWTPPARCGGIARARGRDGMAICEADPWRLQYFVDVPCPEGVDVPTEDADCWIWF